MSTVTWFFPGVGVSIVLGFLFAPAVARALSTGRLVAWLLIVSFGVVLSATLTPIRPGVEVSSVTSNSCDFARIGLAPVADLLTFNDISLNILLFVPLGWALGRIPSTPRKLLLVVGALALPFGIETLQLLAPILNRSCESADVVDNLTGLLLGLIGATVFGWVRRATSPTAEHKRSGRRAP